MRQRVAHEVDATALPRRVQNLGDGRLQPLVGIRDDELDATQTPPRELAQKIGPEGFGFRGADRQAQRLAPAVAIDANRDDHRDRDDVAVAARLHIGRVQPDIGPLPSSGRSRKPVILLSISPHSRDTWLLEMPVMPIARTSSSTERVETPWM